jgi:hypothetical protein
MEVVKIVHSAHVIDPRGFRKVIKELHWFWIIKASRSPSSMSCSQGLGWRTGGLKKES